ncbi:MAG: sugar phosphate isomerase/epimerase [Firmicutes bacterium]|nr:sugar phosphate isomerase/epimerase [Bacillota bacterium]
MKLSFSTLACVDWDLPKIAELADEWGYDGVELRVSGNQHVSPDLSQEERKSIRRLFSRYGLAIPCLAAYTRFAFSEKERRQDNIEELKRVIDLAHDLECPYVRTFGANSDQLFDQETLVEWIAHALMTVDDYAASRGVRVLLETHDVLSRGVDVKRVFEKTGPISAGVLWDVKHPLMKGEAVGETIEHIGDLVYHVHIKDWLTVPGLDQERLLLVGAGELPLAAILEHLEDINYKGYLSLEWEKLWHPDIEDSYIAIYQYAEKMKALIKV